MDLLWVISIMSETRHGDTLVWVCIAILGLAVLFAQLLTVDHQPAQMPYNEWGPSTFFSAKTVSRNRPVSESVDQFEDTRPLPISSSVALFLEAIVQVESAGNPRCVGNAGERGLMQIRQGTWRETTSRLFSEPVPFDEAFNPELNRRVGKAYLASLQEFLLEHRAEWNADMRSLLAACYNGGPNRVLASKFSLQALPSSTQSYVDRVTSLHDFYLETAATRQAQLYANQQRIGSGS